MLSSEVQYFSKQGHERVWVHAEPGQAFPLCLPAPTLPIPHTSAAGFVAKGVNGWGDRPGSGNETFPNSHSLVLKNSGDTRSMSSKQSGEGSAESCREPAESLALVENM